MNEFFYDSYLLILLFLLPGVFLGIVFDVFRILRIGRTADITVAGSFYDKIRPRGSLFGGAKHFSVSKTAKTANTILIFIEDILFWLIAAIIEILFFFHTNGGEIRIYCLIFSALGFFLYNRTIGMLVIACAKQIIFCTRCLIYWIFYAILYPIKAIWHVIQKLLSATIGRWISVAKAKKRWQQSEKRKKAILQAAELGFAVYQKREFYYEGENQYFC